jgi:hypothetical protein
VLCGDDEDERGRRSGIPSLSEKGCEGEDHLREALQKRGSATNLVSKSFVLLVRAVVFIRLQEFWGGLATVFPGTAVVEFDFSIVNNEKSANRQSLSDISAEAF